MTVEQPKPKTLGDVLFFAAMFIICVAGSVGIFVFAVGLEVGNPIVSEMMRTLIENAAVIFVLFVIFNVLIYWIWAKWIRSSVQK